MLVEKFLKYIRYELNHSVHTVLSYSTDLTQFLDFLKVSEEEFSPATVTQEDVRAWVYELTNRKMAVASVRRKVQSLRTFYRWLQRASLVEVNPTEDLPMVKLPSRLPVKLPRSSPGLPASPRSTPVMATDSTFPRESGTSAPVSLSHTPWPRPPKRPQSGI